MDLLAGTEDGKRLTEAGNETVQRIDPERAVERRRAVDAKRRCTRLVEPYLKHGTGPLCNIAVYDQSADRIAGRESTAVDQRRVDHAGSTQRTAGIDKGRRGDRAVDDQRAPVDHGGSGICVGAVQDERTGAAQREAADCR